ncbi:dead end protein 1 isoform X1 [Rhincodon typus]|uniref:dead end protein 1 isoform X1 n=1 Tax=Rhincodon typus TaxID=259920 RepID=UPI00202FD2E9|nr:dead end protein 1 isoform X1 [Rhincodon typus]XP_048459719.1 dead end protein 1 isoform X1 [Rhincodon typus]
MANDLLNTPNKLAFEAWVEETGISLVQINGQRKFGGPPPGWTGPPPLTGCEVFIGKLPQDLYEDKLIPLFQMAGKLYEFRLMMTFSGENRGFAYAKYANRWYAQCAIAMFNGYQICDGLPMVVCKSTEKNELCVRGIPWGKQRLEVLEVLKELTEGVTDLSLHLNKERRKKMALFAVVTYQNHRAAAMAKKTLVEGCIELWGRPIEVDWVKVDGRQKSHDSLLSQTQLGLSAAPWLVLPPGLSLPSPKGLAKCFMPELNVSSNCGQSTTSAGSMGLMTQCLHSEGPGLLNTRCDVVQILNAYCAHKELGTPVYNVQSLRTDQQRFLFKVFLPGLAASFSGTVTLTPDELALGKNKAKQEAAHQILMYLGHSLGFDGFNPPNTLTLKNPF